ncbi:ABC transporter permease [Halosegnis rubeus]|jgi:simple sugar transport system permease protein|uniref:ABC transporter permease n=1 Tax=Halosegnis rubeus TaxID=2212850 RepID=A0A5N5U3I8_9EURY|nr:ABC transporter permease [Halosegnis rubeus]KAB7513136.1 ABC transporter permease [Halosegnis rubeus]KAB7516626.1 ABC transporter permease [Halosegnis rubeus]
MRETLAAAGRRLTPRTRTQTAALVGGVAAFVLVVVGGVLFPGTILGVVLSTLVEEPTAESALRLAVPITLAGLGGIFAEKSGVINIGLEGLLIISAFVAVWMTDVTGNLVAGFGLGVVASTLLALLFAVVCIEFRADQIIAGLAVWLIALGLAPFMSQVIYGGPNTESVGTVPTLTELFGFLPTAGTLPQRLAAPTVGIGPVDFLLGVLASVVTRPPLYLVDVLLDASLSVYLMFLMVAVSWGLLYRTSFGRWVRASGENPKALDTAGVNVSRVRYQAVLLSGVLAGMGGAALALSIGQFTGNGPTMVNGKGFIAIVTYLFGNYNPVGAFLSSLLFAGLDAMQVGLQTAGTGIPSSLVRVIPFVMVIVVLALVGRTRIPEAAGDYYDSGEDR